MREARETAGDDRGIELREQGRSLNVEGLCDHRGTLKELALGRFNLVETCTDRRLNGDRHSRVRGAAASGELDDEQGVSFRSADIHLATGRGLG